MRKRFALAATLTLATMVVVPAGADGDEVPVPPNPTMRYVPRPAGVEAKTSFLFGPYTIPPGHDLNRITLDVPLKNGFYTAVAPQLIDPVTGEEPKNQHAHIHHAHWLRITNDHNEHAYNIGVEEYSQGWHLSWVFGTGEERTQGSIYDRVAPEDAAAGFAYGMYIKGDQPQALIYMIHNKTSAPLTVYVALHVTFVHGTRVQIRDATDCGAAPLLDNETCRAGIDYHPLTGVLWGNTFDVPNDVSPRVPGEYHFPLDIPAGFTGMGPKAAMPYGRIFTAPWGGTFIAGAGHLHPLGKGVILANLGPAGSGCEADSDTDGFPGITLFHSQKLERVAVDFTSEDYQMTATAGMFRAPIHAGDRIAQFGIYRNDTIPTYAAMSFAGMYIDKLRDPGPVANLPGTAECTQGNYGARFAGGLTGDPTTNFVVNHDWAHSHADDLCNNERMAGADDCDVAYIARAPGLATDTVQIAGFSYLPGDQVLDPNAAGLLASPPRVAAGTPLRFVNEEASALIRHTVTSCKWPCNGTYVANYPLPSVGFDSGLLGNFDPVDGAFGDSIAAMQDGDPEGFVHGLPKADWTLDTTGMTPGLYSYFCRIHPRMRGAFEIV